MHYDVYMRNNWSVAWTKVQTGIPEWSGSNEQLSDECTFTVQMTAARLLETDTANLYRMFSEVKIEETDHNGVTFNRWHGFVKEITPSITELTLKCVDFFGICGLIRCDVPATSADTLRFGTIAVPVELVKIVEDGEDRYVPESIANPTAYIGGVPDGTLSNRRTWKAVGGLRDSGANDTIPTDPLYFPDKLIPPSLWTMGSDLLNYVEFIGYTVLGTITVDMLVVYIEGTNQLEDVFMGAMQVALPHGPELVEGVHFDSLSAGYFDKTIWPSLITVNEWKWKDTDGTLADMIDKLMQYAPPNYRSIWDHEKLMLRLQYFEMLPHDTTTPYWVAGSYPYGRVVTAPPAAEVAGDYVDMTEVDPGRTVARMTENFKSKIITSGVNEWPANEVTAAMLTELSAEWPANWTFDGSLAELIDNDFGTYARIWRDLNSSPPASERDKYYPTFHINFGAETAVERMRFWMLDSRRNFPFGMRVEAHNDPAFAAYDPTAPWEPMHKDLWDRMATPFEKVEVSGGGFMRSICRCILISMKPAKIHLRFRYAAGFSDFEITSSSTVSGRAYVVGVAPGAGWTLIVGAGGTGSWYQKVGTGDNDGEIAVLLPNLFNQLVLPCKR
jgi:hypothetical protein